MKLGLGTVQFGIDYGITNTHGKPGQDEIRRILDHAALNDVETLDTAALYGDSEAALGAALKRPHPFKIVTKTLTWEHTADPDQSLTVLADRFERSLALLGENQIEGLLVHRCADLLGPDGERLFDQLTDFRDKGLVNKIGASVYTADEAQALLQRFPLDIVQLPMNPFDQRHLDGGSIGKLTDAGTEIHVRSAFLQGILLADSAQAPAGLEGLSPYLSRWNTLLAETGMAPIDACFAFLKSISGVSVAICGATSLAEWQEVVAGFQAAPTLDTKLFKKLAVPDVKLIDPRYWPKR